MFGFCHLSCIPVRREATSVSEMVTQVLWGETMECLEERGEWARVRIDIDHYEGWVNRWQVSWQDTPFGRPGKVFVKPLQAFGTIWMPAGALWSEGLPGTGEEEGWVSVVQTHPRREALVKSALHFLGAPYLWGGKTIMGCDCSGFVQVIYRIHGELLLRDARDQATQGTTLSFLEEAQIGDLAFFDNEQGDITHVGILMGNGQIIHASGEVRLDSIDQKGIFNKEQNKYTHNLRTIKSLLP